MLGSVIDTESCFLQAKAAVAKLSLSEKVSLGTGLGYFIGEKIRSLDVCTLPDRSL